MPESQDWLVYVAVRVEAPTRESAGAFVREVLESLGATRGTDIDRVEGPLPDDD
jgi:hypothetical protein